MTLATCISHNTTALELMMCKRSRLEIRYVASNVFFQSLSPILIPCFNRNLYHNPNPSCTTRIVDLKPIPSILLIKRSMNMHTKRQ